MSKFDESYEEFADDNTFHGYCDTLDLLISLSNSAEPITGSANATGIDANYSKDFED